MLKQLPLAAWHKEHAFKMADFAGFEMPIWYSSLKEEHSAVRNTCGMFDISHMGQFYFTGPDAEAFLDKICISSIAKLETSQGVYTCICKEDGGILDEAAVYKLPDKFVMVCDASCYEKLVAWYEKVKQENNFDVQFEDKTMDLAFFAVQGPDAVKYLEALGQSKEGKKRFTLHPFKYNGHEVMLSMTGYTGEAGFELLFEKNGKTEQEIWDFFINAGVVPCGLGARDSLRIECGFTLYEHETVESVTPLEAKFGWMIDWDKDFIGKEALAKQKEQGVTRKLRGLLMKERGIARQHYEVRKDGAKIGEVTSGTLSPLTNEAIAIGLLSMDAKLGDTVHVVIRDEEKAAKVVKPPFYDKEKFGMGRKQ